MQGSTCQQITRGQDAQQLFQQLTSWKRNTQINKYFNKHLHIYTRTSLCNTHAVSWRDPWRIWRNTGPCIFGHNLSPTSPSCSQLGFEDKGQSVWMVCPHLQSIHFCIFSSSDIPFPVCARVAGTMAYFTQTITDIDKDNKCICHDLKLNGLMEPHLICKGQCSEYSSF